MKRRKIVLIGAGSVSFTPRLVADILLSPDLGPWELGLVDIDARALQTAEGLARRMTDARGADVLIQTSVHRREILPGADVVVTTISVGGREGWKADVVIPRKYGIYQPVGDTVMAGGISRAMRMVQAMVDIARDVVDLCPEARFLNYANPMTVICWAVRKVTGAEVVGLCIGVFHVIGSLAQFIGAPHSEVTALAVGVNHLTFVFDLRWQGCNAWPLVRARLAEERGQPVDRQALEEMFPGGDTTLASEAATRYAFRAADNPFSWSIFEAYGAYPAVHDRHVVEFFPEQFPNGHYYGMTLGVDAFSIDRWFGDERFAEMEAIAKGEKPLREDLFERAPGEHSRLLEILRSMDRDDRRIFSANLPNRGAVPNLPDDAVLELPAVATAGGLRPLQILDFPDTLAAILNRKLAAERLTMEAALAGDRKLFVEALLADGCVTDRTVAKELAEELLEAHRENLPNFFPA